MDWPLVIILSVSILVLVVVLRRDQRPERSAQQEAAATLGLVARRGRVVGTLDGIGVRHWVVRGEHDHSLLFAAEPPGLPDLEVRRRPKRAPEDAMVTGDAAFDECFVVTTAGPGALAWLDVRRRRTMIDLAGDVADVRIRRGAVEVQVDGYLRRADQVVEPLRRIVDVARGN